MLKYYILLTIAIAFEVCGTLCLKLSNGFQNGIYVALVFISYIGSLTFFGLALKGLSISLAYAIWCGLGILGITFISVLFYNEKIDLAAFLGITLIILGVVSITLFSNIQIH